MLRLVDKLLDLVQSVFVCSVALTSPDEVARYFVGGTVRRLGVDDVYRYRITYMRNDGTHLYVYGVQVHEDDSVVDRGWHRLTFWLLVLSALLAGYHIGLRIVP